MFCLRWVCRWNAPVPPSVSHLANGQLRKKSPMLAMPLTESRSEPKTPANMPSLRQLEFEFRSTNLLFVRPPGVSPGELINESACKMPAGHTAETAVLLKTARELLRSLGAKRIATELRVECNSRLKTAAGRADYRQKLISLNPRLVEHSAEVGDGFHRTDPSGSRLVAIWESQARSAVIRCRFRRRVMRRVSSTVARIAGAIFLAYAGSNAQSHVSPVAVHITAANSTHGFDWSC